MQISDKNEVCLTTTEDISTPYLRNFLTNNKMIMQNMKKQIRKGFTLVELMIVIAIIGALAGLMFPMLSSAFRTMDLSTASTYSKQIADCYNQQNFTPNKQNIHKFAESMAKKGLNNTKIWCLDFDQLVKATEDEGKKLPGAVLENKKLNKEFREFPISWEIAVSTPKNAKDGSLRPLVWTRGLTRNGVWDTSKSVFDDENVGVIAFADGHTESYTDGLKGDDEKGMLTSVNGGRTFDYNKAVVKPAKGQIKILKWKGSVSSESSEESSADSSKQESDEE